MTRCDVCGGIREQRLIQYPIVHNGECALLENVPATVCSRCGEKTFDPDTAEIILKTAWGEREPTRVQPIKVYDLQAA